jgi:cyclic-di-GMP-binding biofilm dispersal mediator protein
LNPYAVGRMIDINLRASYHAMVETAPRMNGRNRITVIGASTAIGCALAGAAAHGLVEFTARGVVRGLARDLGCRGITMNPASGKMAGLMYSVMASEIAELVAYITGPHPAMITGAM